MLLNTCLSSNLDPCCVTLGSSPSFSGPEEVARLKRLYGGSLEPKRIRHHQLSVAWDAHINLFPFSHSILRDRQWVLFSWANIDYVLCAKSWRHKCSLMPLRFHLPGANGPLLCPSRQMKYIFTWVGTKCAGIPMLSPLNMLFQKKLMSLHEPGRTRKVWV